MPSLDLAAAIVREGDDEAGGDSLFKAMSLSTERPGRYEHRLPYHRRTTAKPKLRSSASPGKSRLAGRAAADLAIWAGQGLRGSMLQGGLGRVAVLDLTTSYRYGSSRVMDSSGFSTWAL